MALLSKLLLEIPGIEHGFGDAAEPLPSAFAAEWDLKKPKWRQVHGANAAQVLGPGQECGEIDAIWTRGRELPIAVVTADCVPVLLARPAMADRPAAVAAVHAGWRGTRARILERLWDKLAATGERASEWSAAVGPSIGPCCYEVSEELASEFRGEFGWAEKELVIERPARHLDLPGINAAELRRLGLGTVDLIRACTRCSRDDSGAYLFRSYRREGGGTRQWSVIRAR